MIAASVVQRLLALAVIVVAVNRDFGSVLTLTASRPPLTPLLERVRARLVLIDQMTSARTPGKKPKP